MFLQLVGWVAILLATLWLSMAAFFTAQFFSVGWVSRGVPLMLLVAAAIGWYLCWTTSPLSLSWSLR